MPKIFPFVLAAMLLLMSVPRLAAFFGERSDIWWTPEPLALAPAEAKDRVQVIVRGEPLERVLDSGVLEMKTGAGVVPLGAQDVKLRINNWDRRRAARGPILVLSGMTAGAGILFLVFGLAGVFDRRRMPA
jgi:hypothetical protein